MSHLNYSAYKHLKGKQYIPDDFKVGEDVALERVGEESVFGKVQKIDDLLITIKLQDGGTQTVKLTPAVNRVIRKIAFFHGLSWDRCNHRWRCQVRVNDKQRRLATKLNAEDYGVYTVGQLDQHQIAEISRGEIAEMIKRGERVEAKWGQRMSDDLIWKVRVKRALTKKPVKRIAADGSPFKKNVSKKRKRKEDVIDPPPRKRSKRIAQSMRQAPKRAQSPPPPPRIISKPKHHVDNEESAKKFRHVIYNAYCECFVAVMTIGENVYINGRWPNAEKAAQMADELVVLYDPKWNESMRSSLNFANLLDEKLVLERRAMDLKQKQKETNRLQEQLRAEDAKKKKEEMMKSSIIIDEKKERISENNSESNNEL